MIGTIAHLGARALDTVRAEVAEARRLLGWGLVFAGFSSREAGAWQQVEILGAECDALRAERDQARAALADAQLAARQAERRADGRQAAVDRLTAERDAARASLQNLGGLLSGIARRMTDEEAELALVEMAEAGAPWPGGPSEVEQLAAEVDLLRVEVAQARGERDDERAKGQAREVQALQNFNAYCRERHQLDALATLVRALVDARRAFDTAPAAERSAAALALLAAWKPVCDLFAEEPPCPT